MKKILSGTLFCLVAGGAGAAPITTDGMFYANKISAYGITAIQQSISTAAFGAYDYYGLHVGKTDAPKHANNDTATGDAAHMYGTMPMYGTLPLYGEWNDDGSVTRGRSGGDTIAPNNLNVWLRWTHARNDEKFENFKTVHSNNDLIIGGMGTNKAEIGAGWFNMGVFGGYTGGRAHNQYVDTDQNGGFLGLYAAYNINRFRAGLTTTAGKIDVEMPHKFGGDSYDNIWADITAQTTFDVLLDPTFALQPGLRMSYTWVKSSDYIALERTRITNDNFNFFAISPQLRAIKHIGGGWFGSANVRYVWRLADGGDAHTSTGIKLQDLDMGNYTEYGIGLEKAFGTLNTSIDISRQDGDRRGWLGGIHIKYVF